MRTLKTTLKRTLMKTPMRTLKKPPEVKGDNQAGVQEDDDADDVQEGPPPQEGEEHADALHEAKQTTGKATTRDVRSDARQDSGPQPLGRAAACRGTAPCLNSLAVASRARPAARQQLLPAMYATPLRESMWGKSCG